MGARGGNGGLATTAAGLISAGERVVPRPPRPPPWGCGLSSLRGSQPVSSEHDRELLRAARGGRAGGVPGTDQLPVVIKAYAISSCTAPLFLSKRRRHLLSLAG